MGFQLRTIKGYDFFEASSAMQKAIRRNDAKVAGYFALELFHSNYILYVWKRLLTISAEDCFGLITNEVFALYQSYNLINAKTSKHDPPKGRVFLSKAVLLLAECKKSRDADHLTNLVYDQVRVDADEYLGEIIKEVLIVPEYAYDMHTAKGKKLGKTKEQFIKEELECLKPRMKGLFDDLVP